MTSQGREVEIQHLRQQLARLEADRLSMVEQLRTLRSEAVIKNEEIQRLKSELASEKFQREHTKQQLHQLRTARTSPGTRPSPPAPTTSPKQPPLFSPPHKEPAQDSLGTPHHQPDSLDGGEIFTKERESMASESARLIGELLSSSQSPHSTPPSHSHSSSNNEDSPH